MICWRIMLNYPLGNTGSIMPSSIVNIIGSEGYSGVARYEGLTEVLKMITVCAFYGKVQTKPGRKMGHVTIMSDEYQELTYKANKIKYTLKVVKRQPVKFKTGEIMNMANPFVGIITATATLPL